MKFLISKSALFKFNLYLVIIVLILVPYLSGAVAIKKIVTCQFGETQKEVECYIDKNALIGGRMSEQCICCGNCQLADALAFGLNIADLILKFLGVIALVLFIYGGILWIFSGGSESNIKKGKTIITGAVIGMVVVLAAFLIVQTFLKSIGSTQLLEEKKASIWLDCPDPPTEDNPWCYGCTWVGGADRGCQGRVVTVYQTVLNAKNCNCGTADGKFGPQTKSCTERFQQANGLSPDGMVGPKTYETYKKCQEGLAVNDCFY